MLVFREETAELYLAYNSTLITQLVPNHDQRAELRRGQLDSVGADGRHLWPRSLQHDSVDVRVYRILRGRVRVRHERSEHGDGLEDHRNGGSTA